MAALTGRGGSKKPKTSASEPPGVTGREDITEGMAGAVVVVEPRRVGVLKGSKSRYGVPTREDGVEKWEDGVVDQCRDVLGVVNGDDESPLHSDAADGVSNRAPGGVLEAPPPCETMRRALGVRSMLKLSQFVSSGESLT